jgi:hypothetical protein
VFTGAAADIQDPAVDLSGVGERLECPLGVADVPRRRAGIQLVVTEPRAGEVVTLAWPIGEVPSFIA